MDTIFSLLNDQSNVGISNQVVFMELVLQLFVY